MTFLLISFFAELECAYYGPKAQALKQKCSEFSVDCVIEEIPSRGYMKNCLQKPQYILDKFDNANKSVLWVDVDTTILSHPGSFDVASCDVVAAAGKHWPILASPLLFHKTEPARIFLGKWASLCNNAMDSEGINLDHDILCNNLIINNWYEYNGISIALSEIDHIFKIGNSSSSEKRKIMSFINKQI